MSNRSGSHTRDDGRHWLPSQGVDPGPLTELNAECLRLLALRADGAADADLPPLLTALRDSWAALPADAVRRLAAAPFSLFDAGLSAAPRWLEGRVRGVHDQQRCGPAFFDGPAARSITRRMLVYGWHLARSRPRAACLVFGATLGAVESLAACSLSALDAAADRNAELLRPRWATQPIFWRELLAAATTDDVRLHELLLGGIQRLAAETWVVDSPDTTRASFR